MKSISSGKTKGSHPHHRKNKKKKNRKKKYVKFPKHLDKKKSVSEQSQKELEPIISTSINSPMSDE